MPLETDGRWIVTDQDVYGLKVRFEPPTANPATDQDIACRVRERHQATARQVQQQSGRPVLPPRPEGLSNA